MTAPNPDLEKKIHQILKLYLDKFRIVVVPLVKFYAISNDYDANILINVPALIWMLDNFLITSRAGGAGCITKFIVNFSVRKLESEEILIATIEDYLLRLVGCLGSRKGVDKSLLVAPSCTYLITNISYEVLLKVLERLCNRLDWVRNANPRIEKVEDCVYKLCRD